MENLKKTESQEEDHKVRRTRIGRSLFLEEEDWSPLTKGDENGQLTQFARPRCPQLILF